DAVIRRHPYLADARLRRGLAWWALARGGSSVAQLHVAHAIDDVSAAIALRPSWADAWADLGWLRALAGDAASARAAFDRAVALEPARLSIGIARAELLAQSGDRKAAIEEIEQPQRS